MTRPHRDKPWLIRTYAGHSTAAKSNELYRKNLARGQTGLSVAFDLPTQTGYDSDHPLAKGEVGKVGVPISHLGDMGTLFDGIPLEDEHFDDDQCAGGVAAGALHRHGRGAGRGASRAARHDAERHHQGVPVARHLHLPARAVAAADRRHDRVHLSRASQVEPDERVQLSPAGGGGDAGAGDRFRAGQRLRRARCRAGARASARSATSRRWSAASPSSSTPASASSPRCARCVPSPSCGTS